MKMTPTLDLPLRASSLDLVISLVERLKGKKIGVVRGGFSSSIVSASNDIVGVLIQVDECLPGLSAE